MNELPPRTSDFVIEEWTPVIKNSLRGFARVRLPSGMVLHDTAVHLKDGKAWASPASKPQLNRDGVQMKGADGRGLWVPVVGFASRELRDKFSAAVIDALRATHVEALSA
jgi:hypothetical protein